MITSVEEVQGGQDLEEYFLGSRSSGWIDRQYQGYEEAYVAAKTSQGDWNPASPATAPALELLGHVARFLVQWTGNPNPDIRMYRLVGTAFDSFHQADCSIEYEEHAKVFIDLTCRDDKVNPKAVVIRLSHLKKGLLPLIGKKIAILLMRQRFEGDVTDAMWNMSSDDFANL